MVDYPGMTDREGETFAAIHTRGNEITLANRTEMWMDNARQNREIYREGNAQLPVMVAFIASAGPSLRRNGAELKRIPKDGRGIIIGIDVALPALMDLGVQPDICVSLDGDNRIAGMIGDMDTSDIILACSVATSPELIRKWQGPRYFFLNMTGDPESTNAIWKTTRIHKATRAIAEGEELSWEDTEMVFEGIQPKLHPGGNVTYTAMEFAGNVLKMHKVVFCGQDFCWTMEHDFYAGGANPEMAQERMEAEIPLMHTDMWGRKVHTNMSMFNFKIAHEIFARQNPDFVVNATEGGILGIDRDGNKQDYITFMTLREAVDRYVFLEDAQPQSAEDEGMSGASLHSGVGPKC